MSKMLLWIGDLSGHGQLFRIINKRMPYKSAYKHFLAVDMLCF
ncbi:hypothetical protein [Bacillus sp. TL12]|nr:hypothetical protein [Bacillus sp. TL12]